jgi:cell fate regulator YaaT (PSP1 superfamily)
MDEEEIPCSTPRRRHDCGACPRGKLNSYNWLSDVPGALAQCDIVEVQFKNTRKGYYLNSLHIPVEKGDMVAVESSPGHDIGCVTLTGPLVLIQMKRAGIRKDAELRRLFRIAKPADLEKYEESKAREEETMIRSRRIAADLGLNMKIGDVEYQGDGNKAIFYYIADERVDFRQLIKVLADAFKVRIEMRQIGARQEAGRIGGIGPCGRPLCCSTWISNFVSVATSAARFQDLSLNPQKLAGQCAKLKCCLNYEVDAYLEAVKKLPPKDVHLETADATWYFFKADIFGGEIAYSTDRRIPANLTTIDRERAFEIIELNKAGQKPLQLRRDEEVEAEAKENRKVDLLDQDNINRFDKKKKKKKKKKPAAPKAADDASKPSTPSGDAKAEK